MQCVCPAVPMNKYPYDVCTCSSSFIRVSLLISSMWMSFERTSVRTVRLSLDVVGSSILSLEGADGFCGE